jgi:hypothetical protein
LDLRVLPKNQSVSAWSELLRLSDAFYARWENNNLTFSPDLMLGEFELEWWGFRFESIKYRAPGWTYARSASPAEGETLAWLRELGRWLSDRFGWPEPSAVFFVLTNVPPLPDPSFSYEISPGKHFPALDRVVMRVNPEMSAKELAAAYRAIRSQHFRARVRSLTPKHINLALFFASRPDESKWKELLDEWNKSYPKWRYRSESNFARDCREARRRVLGAERIKA